MPIMMRHLEGGSPLRRFLRLLACSLALYLSGGAFVVCLGGSMAQAFLSPQNVPPEHPVKQRMSHTSDALLLLSAVFLALAVAAAVALRRLIRQGSPSVPALPTSSSQS